MAPTLPGKPAYRVLVLGPQGWGQWLTVNTRVWCLRHDCHADKDVGARFLGPPKNGGLTPRSGHSAASVWTCPLVSVSARPVKVHHLALGASDVERVAAFYRDVFSLEECARHHYQNGALRSIWLEVQGILLMVEHNARPGNPGDTAGSGIFLVAFEATLAEHEEVERRLSDRGHPIETRTEFTSYARDPEGNRVAVSHYPRPGNTRPPNPSNVH